MPKYEGQEEASHILGGEVSKFFQENNIGKYGKVERPLIPTLHSAAGHHLESRPSTWATQ